MSMPDFAVFTGARALDNARQLAADLAVLDGGARLEPVDLDRAPLLRGQRARARARRAAGQLGRTTHVTTPVVERDEQDAPIECRVLIPEGLPAKIAEDDARQAPRLTVEARARLLNADANKQPRVRPIPGGAGGVGRKEDAGSTGERP